MNTFIEASAEPPPVDRLAPRWNELPRVAARAQIPERAPRAASRAAAPANPAPNAAPTPTPFRPWTEWMTREEHEAALKGLGADGYPDDVLQHMRDDPMGPYTVGLPEAACRLGLAKSTVYKLFKEGKLPTFTYQRYTNERPKRLIGLRALERWIETEAAKDPGPGRPRGRKAGVKDLKAPEQA